MTIALKLRTIAERLPEIEDSLETEEATKNALIMPFIQALGYDVFNPLEVVPEFTADVGIKRGEKVDYAILSDREPVILIECKPIGEPFLEMDLRTLRESDVEHLEKLSRASFDLDSLITSASDLLHKRQLRNRIVSELNTPSDPVVRAFVEPIYDGRMTQNTIERFRLLLTQTFDEHIREAVDARLKAAIASNAPESDEEPTSGDREIKTTVEEMEGYYAVKAIIRDDVDLGRVHLRDVQTYATVILDDSNRKPICRLWFNDTKKYIGLFDAQKDERRIQVSKPEDIFRHADDILSSLKHVL